MELRNLIKIFFIIILIAQAPASSSNDKFDAKAHDVIQNLLAIPEEKIDFAIAKLIIDKLINPKINIDIEIQKLNTMANQARKLTNKSFPSMNDKTEALKKYLYESGHWNNNHPFSYDMNDPLGKHINNKLMPNYLRSKKGNCVSMPFLFIILGQKLGVDVTASTAPNHIFVKYTDNASGETYNLETTSGANPARGKWIRKNMPMTDTAIANGLYMRKLSKEETVAEMAITLVEYYMEHGRYQQAIATADEILLHNPKSVSALIYSSLGFHKLMVQKGLSKYFSLNEVPANQRSEFRYLVGMKNFYYDRAEDMGYRPPQYFRNQP